MAVSGVVARVIGVAFTCVHRIPRYAVELSEHVDRILERPAEDIVALQTSLSRLIHAKGINMRHLGALFAEASTHACRMMLLIEMVRVCASPIPYTN